MLDLDSQIPISLETPVSYTGGLAPYIVITLECGHWIAVKGEVITLEGMCVHVGIPFCEWCGVKEP